VACLRQSGSQTLLTLSGFEVEGQRSLASGFCEVKVQNPNEVRSLLGSQPLLSALEFDISGFVGTEIEKLDNRDCEIAKPEALFSEGHDVIVIKEIWVGAWCLFM
jgi:hypothetical protein